MLKSKCHLVLLCIVAITYFPFIIPVVSETARKLKCPVHFTVHPPRGTKWNESRTYSKSKISGNVISKDSNVRGSYPNYRLLHYVAIIRHGATYCTAAIVSRRLLFATGRCAVNHSVNVFIIEPKSSKWKLIDVEMIIPHPAHESGAVQKDIHNNFTFIVLKQNISHSYSMKVIIGSIHRSVLSEDDFSVRVIGYGTHNHATGVSELCQVDLPVHSKSYYAGSGQTALQHLFRLGYSSNSSVKHCNGCSGENGAPAFIYDGNSRPMFVGIVICYPIRDRTYPCSLLNIHQNKKVFSKLGLEESYEIVNISSSLVSFHYALKSTQSRYMAPVSRLNLNTSTKNSNAYLLNKRHAPPPVVSSLLAQTAMVISSVEISAHQGFTDFPLPSLSAFPTPSSTAATSTRGPLPSITSFPTQSSIADTSTTPAATISATSTYTPSWSSGTNSPSTSSYAPSVTVSPLKSISIPNVVDPQGGDKLKVIIGLSVAVAVLATMIAISVFLLWRYRNLERDVRHPDDE